MGFECTKCTCRYFTLVKKKIVFFTLKLDMITLLKSFTWCTTCRLKHYNYTTLTCNFLISEFLTIFKLNHSKSLIIKDQSSLKDNFSKNKEELVNVGRVFTCQNETQVAGISVIIEEDIFWWGFPFGFFACNGYLGYLHLKLVWK